MADLDKAFKAFAKELKQVIKAATGEGGDPSKLPTLDSVGEIGEVSSEETKKKIAYMAELTATQVQYNNILGDTAAAGEALLKLEAHERECAQRMKNIQFQLDTVDKRLDQGMHKFKSIERLLWLLYPLILGLDVIGQKLI